jgi:hypothetical protein
MLNKSGYTCNHLLVSLLQPSWYPLGGGQTVVVIPTPRIHDCGQIAVYEKEIFDTNHTSTAASFLNMPSVLISNEYRMKFKEKASENIE